MTTGFVLVFSTVWR